MLHWPSKKAAAFGSYGWSGEVVKQLTEKLKDCGFEVVNEGIRSLWVPDEKEIGTLIDFGKNFAEQIK